MKFRADRWYPIANMTIQHRMRVYDYYEPGMAFLTSFNPLPRMPILGSSNSAANKDMMSKIRANGVHFSD